MKHVIILPYYSNDEIKRYLWIANFLKEFTVTKYNYEFLLAAHSSIQPSSTLFNAFVRIAPTKSLQCKTKISGFPQGPAAVFWEIMEYINGHYEKDGGFSLWLESDMIPVKANWLDRLTEQWLRIPETVLMGLYVPDRYIEGGGRIAEHINGGACYAKDFANFLPQEGRKPSFDVELFRYIRKTQRFQKSNLFAFAKIDNLWQLIHNSEKVILHGFKQNKDRFIKSCLRSLRSPWLGEIEARLRHTVSARKVRRLIDSLGLRRAIVTGNGRNMFRSLHIINKFLSRRPLMLKLETTNICDAQCNFCGYPKMKRKKQIMSVKLFEKVVGDYAAMGGGAVTLTPCAGELLADPYLIERFRILKQYEEIDNVSFTTNLIAHRRLSDQQWIEILRSTYYLQVSIGGIDRDTYIKMFGVDKSKAVIEGIERIMSLKKNSDAKTIIALGFRTDRDDYLELKRNDLSKFFKDNTYIANLASYANWAAILSKENTAEGTNLCQKKPNRLPIPCAIMVTMLGVLSSGAVTACPCYDMNGTLFPLGNVTETNLSGLYTASRRMNLLKRRMNFKADGCLHCSHYTGWDQLIHNNGVNLNNPQDIPLFFYRHFSGG